MASNRTELQALKNLISEVDLVLSTTIPLPENRTPRCRELLRTALTITDDLLKQKGMTPAELMGRRGGSATAQKHGAEHFRELAAKRKKHAGGRPRKTSE